MTAVAILLIGGGVLLVYAGITGENIVTELQRLLGGGNTAPPAPEAAK